MSKAIRVRKLWSYWAMVFCFLCPYLIAEETSNATPYSDTLYVSDSLKVALRSGPSTKHRIIDFLTSGTTLKAVAHSTDNQWIKVINPNLKQGWIKQEYTATSPAARMLLARSQSQSQLLKQKINDHTNQYQSLRQQLEQSHKKVQTLQAALNKTQQEYKALLEISQNAKSLDESNRTLHKQLEQLEIQQEQLTIENHLLKNDKHIKGITQGTLAVLCGVLLAIYIPKLNPKKRRSGWDDI